MLIFWVVEPKRQYIDISSSEMDMSRECVIASVLSHHNKNLKWLTSVAAWLELRVLFGKQWTEFTVKHCTRTW